MMSRVRSEGVAVQTDRHARPAADLTLARRPTQPIRVNDFRPVDADHHDWQWPRYTKWPAADSMALEMNKPPAPGRMARADRFPRTFRCPLAESAGSHPESDINYVLAEFPSHARQTRAERGHDKFMAPDWPQPHRLVLIQDQHLC